jgi:phosphatidylinositol alpha-1,6-mannosyltransferase
LAGAANAWTGNCRSRCFLIPNTIDLARFEAVTHVPAALRAHLGLEGRPVVFTLGRLSSAERYKGYDELLEVLPRLLETRPGLVYVLGGSGDDRRRLEAKADALGVGHAVRFAGYVPEDEKPQYYRPADVFVLAGRGEGFGIVLLEALASGCAVVASRLDGSAEAIANGELGLLVDPGDSADLQAGLEKALTTGRGAPPAGLQQFGHAAFASRVRAMLTQLGPSQPAAWSRDAATVAGADR